MRKGYRKQLIAAALDLCTLLSVNICPNAFSSVICSDFAKSEPAELEAETENSLDFCDGSDGMSGGLEYAAFRRMERVKRSVSWSFSVVVLKTVVFPVLVLFLALAVGGREQTVQMTILLFIHNKDGKKEKTALFT